MNLPSNLFLLISSSSLGIKKLKYILQSLILPAFVEFELKSLQIEHIDKSRATLSSKGGSVLGLTSHSTHSLQVISGTIFTGQMTKLTVCQSTEGNQLVVRDQA